MTLHQRHCLALLATLTATPSFADLSVTSQVDGLEFILLDTLPAAPAGSAEVEFCDHLTTSFPLTDAGKLVRSQGWQVTEESPLGDLTAVSFVGSTVPSTSGTCELLDGNVGLFSGDQLVALLYARPGAGPMIGRFRLFGDTAFWVLSGDVVPIPVAELQLTGSDAVTALPLADTASVCNGTAMVPNLHDLPIDEARKRLLAAGWQPVPGDPETQAQGWAKDIAAAGVPEVENCAGTGFAFCSYSYSGQAGTLSVTTAGEGGENGSLPMVSSYGADCR